MNLELLQEPSEVGDFITVDLVKMQVLKKLFNMTI